MKIPIGLKVISYAPGGVFSSYQIKSHLQRCGENKTLCGRTITRIGLNNEEVMKSGWTDRWQFFHNGEDCQRCEKAAS